MQIRRSMPFLPCVREIVSLSKGRDIDAALRPHVTVCLSNAVKMVARHSEIVSDDGAYTNPPNA